MKHFIDEDLHQVYEKIRAEKNNRGYVLMGIFSTLLLLGIIAFIVVKLINKDHCCGMDDFDDDYENLSDENGCYSDDEDDFEI